jgi:hypothetical protein
MQSRKCEREAVVVCRTFPRKYLGKKVKNKKQMFYVSLQGRF